MRRKSVQHWKIFKLLQIHRQSKICLLQKKFSVSINSTLDRIFCTRVILKVSCITKYPFKSCIILVKQMHANIWHHLCYSTSQLHTYGVSMLLWVGWSSRRLLNIVFSPNSYIKKHDNIILHNVNIGLNIIIWRKLKNLLHLKKKVVFFKKIVKFNFI